MQLIITKAIRDQRLLRLIYDSRARTVEPHAFGLIDAKCEAMLCWQVSPPMRSGERWCMFHLDKISGLRMLDEQFELVPNRPPFNEEFLQVHATHFRIAQPSNLESGGGDTDMLQNEEVLRTTD